MYHLQQVNLTQISQHHKPKSLKITESHRFQLVLKRQLQVILTLGYSYSIPSMRKGAEISRSQIIHVVGKIAIFKMKARMQCHQKLEK